MLFFLLKMNFYNRSMFNMPYSGINEVADDEGEVVEGYKLEAEIAYDDGIDVFADNNDEIDVFANNPESNDIDVFAVKKKDKKKTKVDDKIKKMKNKIKTKK